MKERGQERKKKKYIRVYKKGGMRRGSRGKR